MKMILGLGDSNICRHLQRADSSPVMETLQSRGAMSAAGTLTTLTLGAEVGRAAGVGGAADGGFAFGAGLTFAVVDAPATLVAAAAEVAAVDVLRVYVHRGAVGERLAEDVKDCPVKLRDLTARQVRGRGEGAHAREVEHFGGVDVAEPRDLRL